MKLAVNKCCVYYFTLASKSIAPREQFNDNAIFELSLADISMTISCVEQCPNGAGVARAA